MSGSDDFVSIENKGLLWNVLYENNAFDGIPKDDVARVQELFEQSIVSMNTKDNDLITLNKNFIGSFIQKVDGLKKRSVPLTHGRKEQVNTQFQSKQQELTALLNPKPPTDINFSDMDDQPLDNRKIDDMLEATIRQRELDMEIPPPTENKTQHKWLSGESAVIDNKSKNIKIGDEISSDQPTIKLETKQSKRVAWADEKNTVISPEPTPLQNNFFQKLKPKPVAPEVKSDIYDRLGTLEKKVDEIHTMLKQLISKEDTDEI